MSQRGRPRATYADQHITTAYQTPGRWSVLPCATEEADKVARKIRREGLEAKFLVLDETNALVATRSTDGNRRADQETTAD